MGFLSNLGDWVTNLGDELLGIEEPSVPAPPGLSTQETELMGLQSDWIKWQMEQAQTGAETREELMPFLLESLGLRYSAETGELEQIPDELADLYRETQLAALRGDYTSPVLETQLTRQRGLAEEAFARKYGGNWQQTTAGQKALINLTESENLQREQARLSYLGMGQGLMGQYGQFGAAETSQVGQGLSYTTSPYGMPDYATALSPYQQQRGLQYQGMLTQAQLQGQQQAGLMNMLGQVGGMGLGGWLYGRS